MPHSEVHTRAGFAESLRVGLARELFRFASWMVWISVGLMPKQHPTRKYVEATLQLRRERVLATFVPPADRGKHTRANVITLVLSAYTTLDLLSTHIPGPFSPLPVDDWVHILDRIAGLFAV